MKDLLYKFLFRGAIPEVQSECFLMEISTTMGITLLRYSARRRIKLFGFKWFYFLFHGLGAVYGSSASSYLFTESSFLMSTHPSQPLKGEGD
jgi:hypothetical protein